LFVDPSGDVCRGFFVTCDVRHDTRAIGEVMELLTRVAEKLYGAFEQPSAPPENERKDVITLELNNLTTPASGSGEKPGADGQDTKVYKRKRFTVFLNHPFSLSRHPF
jgi:hypothetical protein